MKNTFRSRPLKDSSAVGLKKAHFNKPLEGVQSNTLKARAVDTAEKATASAGKRAKFCEPQPLRLPARADFQLKPARRIDNFSLELSPNTHHQHIILLANLDSFTAQLQEAAAMATDSSNKKKVSVDVNEFIRTRDAVSRMQWLWSRRVASHRIASHSKSMLTGARAYSSPHPT